MVLDALLTYTHCPSLPWSPRSLFTTACIFLREKKFSCWNLRRNASLPAPHTSIDGHRLTAKHMKIAREAEGERLTKKQRERDG